MEDNLRIQDIVARVSGIPLKSTVRVLRALQMVAQTEGEEALCEALNALLASGAHNGDILQNLDAPPSAKAVEACDEAFGKVIDRYGWERLKALHRLENCVYYEQALIDQQLSEK